MTLDRRVFVLTVQDDATDGVQVSGSTTGIVGFQITGTWTGTITFQGTVDGTNWVSVLAVPSDSTSAATTATANGIYRVDAGGFEFVRAKLTTLGSGGPLTIRAGIQQG